MATAQITYDPALQTRLQYVGIEPNKGNLNGLLISTAIALVPTGLVKWAFLFTLPGSLQFAIAGPLLMTFAGGIYQQGWRKPIELGDVGVGLSNGNPNGKLYYPGKHWCNPLSDDIVRVNVQARKIDPTIFEELADDETPVEIDGFFVVRVFDPILFYSAKETDETLEKFFRSKVRDFIGQWNDARKLSGNTELVATFLALPSDISDPAHAAFRQQLMALTVPQGEDIANLSVTAVDELMAKAGSFKQRAEQRGFRINEVEIERIDIPERMKKAAEERQAQRDIMASFAFQNEERKKMAASIMDLDTDLDKEQRISARDAINLVDRLMKLDVKTDIKEYDVRDLRLIARDVGGPVASLLAEIIKRLDKKS